MSPTVMIVEDNPITRKMVCFALETQGFTVVDAADAGAALRAFPAHAISLVLQDLLLPDMDGVELVRRLRALPGGAEVPILAFSGMLSKGDEARFAAAGFDDVIIKPVEPSRLLQIVRTHLPPTETLPPPTATQRRVVLADDDAVQRKLAAYRMQKAGFDVTTAGDGVEALERVRELRPDVIVSDVLMPRLDGFGLCMAVRSDPALASIPIVLVTNSYLEADDRELARRAGANDLVLRTPELREVLASVATTLAAAPGRVARPAPVDPEVERERVQRVMKQLERQVALNASANQRCALLSAELSVLSAISEAVATQHDIDAALRQALMACFDAGGISMGALYLDDGAERRVLRFGPTDGWSAEETDGFFGHGALLQTAVRSQTLIAVPSEAVPAAVGADLLRRARATSLLITPLGHQSESLGALVMVSRSTDLQSEDRVVFALAVAGQISLALALARSFAAKDASERAARGNAAVVTSILESMADGVIVTDAGGAISRWNPAAEAILGLHPGAEPWTAVFASDQVTPLATADQPLVRAQRGEAVDGAELFLRRADKPEGAWLSVSARPLQDGAGSGGAVAVFRDVTADKAAHTQLMVSDRMASLGTLAAGVGHEINNPLMTVLGNLDLAIKDLEQLAATLGPTVDLGELPGELSDAHHAADRIRLIVRDLKLFSRVEEDRLGVLDVHEVLESSLRMAWTEIRHRARLIRAYTAIPQVAANEARLGQIFLNLIVNAAQAIPEGRARDNEITIVTRADAGKVRVEITDTGQGIPPEVMARMFTPFFTTKPIGVGTGLGLAICHRLVTAIGGEITVESAVGRGTTFTVILPAGDAVRSSEVDPVRPGAARRRGRVLVVDDEPTITAVVHRALGGEHDVVGLTDGQDALRRITAGERYDVILCDLMMPTFTGMDLHAELVKIAPDQAAAMVFITGGAFTPGTRALLQALPNACLEKPFDLLSLRAVVNERIT